MEDLLKFLLEPLVTDIKKVKIEKTQEENVLKFTVAVPKDETPRLKHEHSHLAMHMPAHFIASFLGPSLVLPYEKGKLVLGEYQRVVLVELNGPDKREVLFGC